MACLTSCPSGVAYDRLIESTRAEIEETHSRSPIERTIRALVFAVFPPSSAPARGARARATRAEAAAATPADAPPRAGATLALAGCCAPGHGRTRPKGCSSRPPDRLCAARAVRRRQRRDRSGARRRRRRGHRAERAVLLRALSLHAGRLDEGRERARRLIETFERAQVEQVVTNRPRAVAPR